MPLDPAELDALHQLVNLHGHLSDAGAFDRFTEVFTTDVRYDVGATGIEGLDALVAAGRALGAGNPVAHHVTNAVFDEDGDEVRGCAKGLGLSADGTVASVVYRDRIVRTPAGWRIAHRTVLPRRTPLEPYDVP